LTTAGILQFGVGIDSGGWGMGGKSPVAASEEERMVALSRWRRRNAIGLQLLKFQAAVTASRHVLIAAGAECAMR
jgi:hypothetical protein